MMQTVAEFDRQFGTDEQRYRRYYCFSAILVASN
jgi:hypothetical protein